DRQSKLKVLRAAVDLSDFTAGEVMARTGLERSQVDPQIARLREEGIIEYDPDPPSSYPRPPHRPLRFYRLTRDKQGRSKAFAEIRAVRAALGDDDLSSPFLISTEGKLETLHKLLASFQTAGTKLNRTEYSEYAKQLHELDHALDQLTLELDRDQEP